MNIKKIKKGVFKINKYKKKVENNPDIIRIEKLKLISNSQPKTSHRVELEDFEKKDLLLKKFQNELVIENNNFIESYANVQKLYPKNTEEKFHDLITQYKQRGYKIPDLSIKRNLFTPNPLLLDKNKVNNYYSFYKKKKKTISLLSPNNKDKHLQFLKNEENLVEKELFKIRKKKRKDEGKDYSPIKTEITEVTTEPNGLITNNTIYTDYSTSKNKSILNKIIQKKLRKELKKENEEIKTYNESISNLITRIKFHTFSVTSFSTPKKKRDIFSPYKHQKSIASDFFLRKNSDYIGLINRRSSLPIFHQKSTSFPKRRKNNVVISSPQINSNLIKILENENSQNHFLQKLEKVQLTKLPREELNKIVKIYCKKFRNYKDGNIEKLLEPHISDKEVIFLIKDFIKKNDLSNIIKRDFPNNPELVIEEKKAEEKSKQLEYKFADYNASKIFY
jgi:hypothetical protein